MDKNQALEKIKKCLALSRSANEHEAAQALKHAQALMREYGLSAFDVELAEVVESGRMKCPVRPPEWQGRLVDTVGAAFGVRAMLTGRYNRNSGKMEAALYFYGTGGKPDLAQYAYEVLLRQLKAARRDYIASALNRVRTAKNKTYRADQYCLGWLASVWSKLDEFVNSERETALLDEWKKAKSAGTASFRKSSASDSVCEQSQYDRSNGFSDGKKAELHHGMGKNEQKMIGA